MTRRAWLIDVWETLLSVDFDAMLAQLANVGRVPVDELGVAAYAYVDEVTIGELSIADAFEQALTSIGAEPTARLGAEVAATQKHFLLSSVTVFDDAVSFIARSRRRGDLVALVSNCGDDTRPLLEARGLVGMVDSVVLSCEIGHAKPDRAIFDHTIGVLGIDPSEGTLIDDQQGFCQGAVAAGLRAIHLVRDGDPATSGVSAITTARSFDEIV
jgi:putative hydrolase of the HAD superfamily